MIEGQEQRDAWSTAGEKRAVPTAGEKRAVPTAGKKRAVPTAGKDSHFISEAGLRRHHYRGTNEMINVADSKAHRQDRR